jgi:hypothetical protein
MTYTQLDRNVKPDVSYGPTAGQSSPESSSAITAESLASEVEGAPPSTAVQPMAHMGARIAANRASFIGPAGIVAAEISYAGWR